MLRIILRHLRFCGSLIFILLSSPTWALPQGWESYSTRPDILNVDVSELLKEDSKTREIEQAHINFAAELLAFYPNKHLYFLARDSEYLYDVVKLATHQTADASRIHLLNISRSNMRDPNILKYLEQEGISKETLYAGKEVIFVDTGFSGTIPRVILSNFPAELHSRLKTHLIVSSHYDHPSSRVFLLELNPAANSQLPAYMHGTIVNYEHMARYTDRSTRFSFENGRWEALSPIEGEGDGSVSKSQGVKFMAGFKAALQWEGGRFQQKVEKIRSVLSLLSQQNAENTMQLKSLLTSEEKNFIEAVVRDAIEAKRNIEWEIAYELSDLDLDKVGDERARSLNSKKNALIKKFPEWAPFLEDPEAKIPQLVQQKNWTLLAQLLDANVDGEINFILMKRLFATPGTGEQRSLQMAAIAKKQAKLTEQIITSIPVGQAYQFDYALAKLIESSGADSQRLLAQRIFSKNFDERMLPLLLQFIDTTDNQRALIDFVEGLQEAVLKPSFAEPLRRLIAKANSDTLAKMARFAFQNISIQKLEKFDDLLIQALNKGQKEFYLEVASKPYFHQFVFKNHRYFEFVLNRFSAWELSQFVYSFFSYLAGGRVGDLHEDWFLAMLRKLSSGLLGPVPERVFSAQRGHEYIEAIQYVLENGDSRALKGLSQYVFSNASFKIQHLDLFKKLIKRSGIETLEFVVRTNFKNETSLELVELAVRQAIANSDQQAMEVLAEHVFIQPFTKARPDLFALLIENGNARVLWFCARVFYHDHAENWSTPMERLIRRRDQYAIAQLYSLFGRERMQNRGVHLRLIIENSQSAGLSSLINEVFFEKKLKIAFESTNFLLPIVEKVSYENIHAILRYMTELQKNFNLERYFDLLVERARKDDHALQELITQVIMKPDLHLYLPKHFNLFVKEFGEYSLQKLLQSQTTEPSEEVRNFVEAILKQGRHEHLSAYIDFLHATLFSDEKSKAILLSIISRADKNILWRIGVQERAVDHLPVDSKNPRLEFLRKMNRFENNERGWKKRRNFFEKNVDSFFPPPKLCSHLFKAKSFLRFP